MTSHQARIVLGLAVLGLAGCSSGPVETKKKEPEKPPVPITGRAAFYKIYPSARLWATDVQALRVSSIRLDGVKDEPGKSGAWEVTFISPSRLKAKTFTYAVLEGPGNLHKDVFAGLEEDFTGSRGQAKPWVIPAFKVDSDEAYATALKKSSEYVKKFPDKPLFYLLELTPRYPDPAWRVVWGESVTASNYSVMVDATTGEYLETMR